MRATAGTCQWNKSVIMCTNKSITTISNKDAQFWPPWVIVCPNFTPNCETPYQGNGHINRGNEIWDIPTRKSGLKSTLTTFNISQNLLSKWVTIIKLRNTPHKPGDPRAGSIKWQRIKKEICNQKLNGLLYQTSRK